MLKKKREPRGGQRKKGQPALYDEMKKIVTISLTPTGLEGLDTLASDCGLSRSELIEQIGRKMIPVLLLSEDD